MSQQIDLKASILEMTSTMVLSASAYENLSQNIQKKLDESIPVAADPLSQESLTKIHKEYQETLKESLNNLQNQYNLGKRLIEDLSRGGDRNIPPKIEDLFHVSQLLTNFQTNIQLFLNAWKTLEEKTAELEAKIVSLMNIDTQLVSA